MAPQSEMRYDSVEIADVEAEPKPSRAGRVALVVASALLVVAVVGYVTVPATEQVTALEIADVEDAAAVAACTCSNGYTNWPSTWYCGSCYTGYYLSGTNCYAYGGSCSGGYLRSQSQRTANNQCGSCYGGYTLSGTTCYSWGGSCSNGYLRSTSQMTGNNQCGSCYGGYYLSGTTCYGYGGSCSNGWLTSQGSRTQNNHCGSCYSGYYLSGVTCYAWGGSCSNGALLTQSSRSNHNQCGSCNSGYYLSGTSCVAYGGSCTNGALITQSQRTQENHCGSCTGNYVLQDANCNGYGGDCANGVMKAVAARNGPGDCGSCNAGYALSTPDVAVSETSACGGACAAGWSNSEITNVGTAGNMHGPWGNDVTSVSQTFTVSGLSQCTVSWNSYTFNSRDSETDYVYINGAQVWSASPQWSTGAAAEPEGATLDDAGVSTYLSSYCWNGCNGYTYKYANSVTVDCSSGSVAMTFTSGSDQGESDEGWGFNNFEIADASAASTSEASGADASGWSNSEITNVGTAGNMHGPWGNDVTSVSKTFTVPAGASTCQFTWDSWGFSSRDNEVDSVTIGGTQVWSQSMAAGSGSTTNGAEVQTYLGSYCWGSCSSYTLKYSNSATVSCSGTVTMTFNSAINQAESDEGWGFNNVVMTTGAGNPASCLDLLSSGTTANGWYNIYPSGSAVYVYCDMTTDGGGYDMIHVDGGTRTYGKNYANSCPSGMNIVVPRTQAHWVSLISIFGSSRLDNVGVSRTSNGCGTCTGTAMNSVTAPSWEAVDGGSWWFRDSTYNEPNGDYSANCWLDFYNWPSDASDMRWNDGGCGYSSTNYVCSTNTKDPASGAQTGSVSVCTGYAGSCLNGSLRAQTSRTADDQCASCNAGYYLSGTTCVAWAGSCSSGTLIGQSSRTQNNHCGSCYSGYYMSGVTCYAWGGSCANGALITQSSRQQDNHCGSCNGGARMVGRDCTLWTGSCPNGYMIQQSWRTQQDHCGSCQPGYYMTNTNSCSPYVGSCANGVLKAQADRVRHNDCKWCNDGYGFRSNTWTCANWWGFCADGTVKPVAQRLRHNHCNSCGGGKVIAGDARASNYSPGMSGFSGSATVVSEGMVGWTDSAALFQNVPDELVGAVLMKGTKTVAPGTAVSFTPNYDSDIYVIAQDTSSFPRDSTWTSIGTMQYADPQPQSAAYVCSAGMSNSADWATASYADTTEAACAARCDFAAGCSGFDYKGSGDDACRIFGSTAVGMLSADAVTTLDAAVPEVTTETWCNGQKTLSPGMSTVTNTDISVCVASCRADANCGWVGFRRADSYCEFWTADSCGQGGHAQPGHDIYQVDSARRLAEAASGGGGVTADTEGRTWCVMCTPCSDGAGNLNCAGPITPGTCTAPAVTQMSVYRFTQQSQCTDRDPTCSKTLSVTAQNAAVAAFVVDTTGHSCSGCQAGYYASGSQCLAYGGSCSNGQILPQAEREQENHCGSCNDGYYLDTDSACQPYGGSCTNGVLAAQYLRLTENFCATCDAGYMLSDGAEPWCQACGVGTYTAEAGVLPCANCGVGTYQGETAQTGCINCADGYVAVEEGQSACTSCGDGFEPNGCVESDTAGANEEGGAVADGWSNSEITNVGTAGNMHGPWGNDVTSVSKTFSIPAGITECTVSWDSYGFSSRDSETDYVYINGALVWSKVFQWNQSHLSDASGVQTYLQSYCWANRCQDNVYKESVSVTVACSGSMHMTFTSGINQNEADEGWGFNNVAISSSNGWDCAGSKSQCDICPAGMWSHDGDAKCSDCSPGYYAPTEGHRDCVACAPGTHQPASGADACVDCAAGMYQGWAATTYCINCNVGTVTPVAGMAACDACVPGKVMPSIGQLTCIDCPIGEYQPSYQQTHCATCVPGQVTPVPGMPTCDLCATGKQQPSSGQGTCDDCGHGHVAPNEGMPLCDECQMGEFMDEIGQLYCKQCNQPEGSYPANSKTTTTYESPTFPAATAKGFYTAWTAAPLCEPWTECQNCEHIDFQGSRTADRTCVPCEPETWNNEVDEPQCTEWTVCKGNGDPDYDGGDEGLVTLGTCNSDAVCSACDYGQVTINDDFYTECHSMMDYDGDTKFDRFLYNDHRQVGERAARLGRTPYVAEEDFDKHQDPDTGGVYDRCPFDPMDDEDGDDICAEWTPDKLAHFVDQQAGVFYAPGGSRQDFCPYDSDNDLDQDKVCDDVDRQVVTFNFLSNNLVGWTDADCESVPYRLGAPADACGEPANFKVMYPKKAMPALAADVFGADFRLTELVAVNKGAEDPCVGKGDDCVSAQVESTASITAVWSFGTSVDTCDGVCQDHGMVCTRAAGGAQKASATPWFLFEGPYTYPGPAAALAIAKDDCVGEGLSWDDTYEGCMCSTDACADADGCDRACGASDACAMYQYTTAGNGGARCWLLQSADIDLTSQCDPSDNNWCIYTDVSGATCPRDLFLNEASSCVDAPDGFDQDAGCAGVAESCDDKWVAENCALTCGNAAAIDIDAATGDCGAAASTLLCKCEPDPEPIKTEHWSQDKLCPTCHAMSDAKGTGSMIRDFKIKKNTLFYGLKAPASPTQFVRLTVINEKAANPEKALKGQPTIMEVPSATDGDWYPVSWDLSEHVGKQARLEVVDMDMENSIAVDEFEFFSEAAGCLPTCMTIRDDVCAGETCFYFENDDRAYVNVKQINDLEATYCRQVPLREGGSPLGPGLRTLNENGPMRTDYLMATNLPRCFNIDLRGSHIAITIGEGQLGAEDVRRTFAYYPSTGENGITPAGQEDEGHCIYPTLKPRCVDFSKPSSAFKTRKATTCRFDGYIDTCFDQCYKIHCPAEDTYETACGKLKAFQDCATCCDNNDNVASGCFRRRRRRLGASVVRSEANEDVHYTENECAGNCLNRQGCIGYMNEDGGCALTIACNNAPVEQMPEEQAEHGDWYKGTWKIWDSLGAEDLTSGDDDAPGDPKPKKRRRKKKNNDDGPVPLPPVLADGTPLITEEPTLVGGRTDDNGCNGSAGYSWCESSQKCFRPWEEGCMVCTAADESVFARSPSYEQIYTPCCEGLATERRGDICRAADYEPPAPACRVREPAAGGTDCWAVSDYLQEQGLPPSDCTKYFDTYDGGRGCRIEFGRCDGFKDEAFTPCPGEEITEPADGCNGEDTDPNADCWRRRATEHQAQVADRR